VLEVLRVFKDSRELQELRVEEQLVLQDHKDFRVLLV
jgi:hypothetical protein